MSTSFEARFSTTSMKLPKLLERLGTALPACGLRFFGSIMRLQAHDGWPTVSGSEFGKVDSLVGAGAVAEQWWGVGLECVSDVLLQGLGRSDAVEVYLNVFRVQTDRWTVSYLESSSATDFRIRSEEGRRNLSALQEAVCRAGGFDLSIYDEQDHARSPTPAVREAEVAIKRVAADPNLGDLSVVAASKALSERRAKKLAGPRADEIRLSANGYVLLPFLAPYQAAEST